MKVGKKIWAVAEGYIPGSSHGPKPAMESHETLCFLNCNEDSAEVELTLFFKDRGPVRYHLTVPGQRTLHQRLNDLKIPELVPRETDYAMLMVSSLPIVVQHTRLDSRQAENALISTLAYSQEAA